MANSNRRRTTASGSARLSTEETVDSLRATIVHLRSEFDAERKCVRRLRREKAYEVQLAREQERNKATTSMKEMAAKLHQEKEQETENLRCKHKTDVVKVMKQKDKETKKIRKDLAKCQDDLKEEIFKRGLSTSARAAFELERSKLLQDIKELSASRKLAEDALSSALEVEKQRTNELRLLQETSRTEIAKVNRDANTEIKRLLEELKTKDHVVSVMKGNHSMSSRSFVRYPPDHRSIGLAELVNLSKEIEAWQKRFSATSVTAEVICQGGNLPNFSLQRKLYEIEKQLKHVFSVSSSFTEKNNELISINKALEQRVCAMVEQNNALNIDMKTAKGEIRRLSGLMSATGINNLTKDLENLQGQLSYYENRAKLEKRNFKPKKTVRFLLPFEDHEMCAGDDSNHAFYDDGEGDKGGGDGDELEMLDSSETTISLAADISVGENQSGVAEHATRLLEVEHFYHQYNCLHEENPKQPENWRIQKESLKIVIQTLEDKVKRFEDDEQKLKLKLNEVCDQNEELEFQILELENGTDEVHLYESDTFKKKFQWEKENETLRSELLDLKNQVMHYELNDVMERSVATQCGEEMLATDMEEEENLFHKLTDEYKLSLGAEWEKDFYLPCEETNFIVPQNLSNLGQKNHERVSFNSSMTSESCNGDKLVTDMEELLSETKIGTGQGNASSAKCDPNELCKNEAASHLMSQVKSCDGDGVTGEGLMAHDRWKGEMEWMTEVESLKRKLNRSQVREREMKDQLMLLEEEKNRQIKLLQQQMDFLEGPNMSNQQTVLEMEEQGAGQAENNRGGPDVERHAYDGELVAMNRGRNEEIYEETERIVSLKLDTTLNWISTPVDVFMSTPVSGDFSVCPSFEYNDSTVELLHQQVSDLERDRDLLSEIIHKDESIILELQLEISTLHQSETDLQCIVERLEMAEEQMRRKADDVTIQNDDMEKTIEELKESESMLLSNVRKMRATEFELKMRMEEMAEENRSNESTWKRRQSEVEFEKRLLQGKVKELDEQVGDLEGLEIVLKQKIKKMEKLDIHLRNELEDARQECNTLTCHIADLEFEKDVLMQKLEKQNLDFTTKVVHLKQEKEAMNVEMIEIGCRVKILEQTLSSKEGTVSSLELKLHKSELCERELKRKLIAFENMSQLMLSNVDGQQTSETNQEPVIKKVKFGPKKLLELTGSDYFDNCEDCHKGAEELVSSACVNDDQPVENELHNISKESISLTSYPSSSSDVIPSDDVESADEASEIIDEDDGASPPPDGCSTNPEDCWQQLLTPYPCLSFHHLNRQTESPSLDSMNDSGLESLKLDGQVSGHENSVCHPSLTVKPNAYRQGNQSHRVSMIPISIRYLTTNTCTLSHAQNLACTVCNDADSVESQDSQDYIGPV